MLSTGDVHGSLRRLETLLRVIKYPGYVDYNGLSKGDPSAFLPIVSFTLTSFSPPFAKQLMEAGLELTGKTDLRFTDALYKVLRDIFDYKPILTKQQFLQWGFSQRKISVICDRLDSFYPLIQPWMCHRLVLRDIFDYKPILTKQQFLQWGFSQRKISVICDIINLVLQKHNQLKKPRVRGPASHKDHRGEAHPSLTDTDTVSERPFVVNHMENCCTFPTNSSHVEVFSSHNVTCTSHNGVFSPSSPGNGIRELAGQGEDKDSSLCSSEVEARLSALEDQLGRLLSGIDRLGVLQKRVEELEKHRNTDKTEGQVITVSRESWENLMSRVLLLETKLDLSNIQLSVPPPCPSSASSSSSTSMSDASKEDLEDRLERITNMLKSTSSVLKNTESYTTSCK